MSRTAMGAAFCRLVEQAEPPGFRQFSDPLVSRLLDPMLVAMAGPGPMREQLLSSFGPGTFGSQVMRTRYIDDVVTSAVGNGITQVVLLGAGLDTRAYRMHALATAIVFEADLPGIQQQKRKRLRGTPFTAGEVRFVPIDFTVQHLGDELAAAGLDTTRRVLYVWEGVTQYLTEDAVGATLAVAGASAPGSTLVFSYVLRSVIDGLRDQGLSSSLRHRLDAPEPWLFGIEPADVPGLLDGVGLHLIEDVGAAEYGARYLEPIGRRLEINDGERVALAQVPRSVVELVETSWLSRDCGMPLPVTGLAMT